MSGLYQQIALGEPKLAARDKALAAEEQFAALVGRQSRFVFRVVYSVLRNTHDAEDIVQETFLKLYRSGAWKAIQDEKAFLARAAWRLAVERARAKLREMQPSQKTCGRPTPEEELIRQDLDARIQRLIEALPEEVRLPLALSTVEEMSSHEIAAIMGIPDGTVRSRIARARKMLKERLPGFLERGHGQ